VNPFFPLCFYLSLPERLSFFFGKSIYCCRKFANSGSLPASLPLSAVENIPSWTYARDARYKKLKVERCRRLKAKSYLPSTFGKKQRKATVHATRYRSFCYDVKFMSTRIAHFRIRSKYLSRNWYSRICVQSVLSERSADKSNYYLSNKERSIGKDNAENTFSFLRIREISDY